MSMTYEGLKKNKIRLSIEVSECETCHKPMISRYDLIPDHILNIMYRDGIMLESFVIYNICEDCVKRGYPKECDCCGKEKIYPEDFECRLTHKEDCPEVDDEQQYICSECVKNSPNQVIEIMIASDEIHKIDKPEKAEDGQLARDYKILSQFNNQALAEMWCTLNRFEWPVFLPDPEPVEYISDGRRSKLMLWISRRVDEKLISRTWNKDNMTDGEFEIFWRAETGDKEAKTKWHEIVMEKIKQQEEARP